MGGTRGPAFRFPRGFAELCAVLAAELGLVPETPTIGRLGDGLAAGGVAKAFARRQKAQLTNPVAD